MAELEVFLNSRNLVGFQLDGTHLHAVLQRIIHEQRTQAQEFHALARRVDGIDGALAELQDFARRTSSVFDSLGSADEIRSLGQHMRQIETRIESVLVPELRDVRRAAESADRRAQQAAQVSEQLGSTVAQVHEGLQGVQVDVNALSENQRSFAGELREASTRVNEVQQTRSLERQRGEDAVREALARLERMEREALPKVYADMEDLNRRSDENFRSVEVAVRQFEDDHRRAKADIGNLRAELNALDNDASHRINKMKEDADGKFAMLLQLMQSFEKNSILFEQHMAEAGRALQNPRAPSRAVSEAPTPTLYRPSYGSAAGSGGALGGSDRGGVRGLSSWSPQGEFTGTTRGGGDAVL
jgi:uncharacterized phage infection (PIP) family protein YhgE